MIRNKEFTLKQQTIKQQKWGGVFQIKQVKVKSIQNI